MSVEIKLKTRGEYETPQTFPILVKSKLTENVWWVLSENVGILIQAGPDEKNRLVGTLSKSLKDITDECWLILPKRSKFTVRQL